MDLFTSMNGHCFYHQGSMRPSPVREFLGQELYTVDCCGAVLYVHEQAVVIDETADSFSHSGETNFKVLPYRAIVAIRAKWETTMLNGCIEFETVNSSPKAGCSRIILHNGMEEGYEQAKEALHYIFVHICK